MARRIPRYARLSPDTATDESSEEDLPNFTLINEESILPEGSKRSRTVRVAPQQLVIEEELLEEPKPRRRTRGAVQEEEIPEVREPKRRGRPSRLSSSPEITRTPRRLKRRRVLPESDDESGVSEQEDEEEPIRPMRSRRSARKASITAPIVAVEDVRSRESSSDLSPPPESLMDLDSEEDEKPDVEVDVEMGEPEMPEVVLQVEEEKKVEKPKEEIQEPTISTAKKRGRPPAVKIPDGTSKPKRKQPIKKTSSSVNSTIEVEEQQQSPQDSIPNVEMVESPIPQTPADIVGMDLQTQGLALTTPTATPISTEAKPLPENSLPTAVIPTVEPVVEKLPATVIASVETMHPNLEIATAPLPAVEALKAAPEPTPTLTPQPIKKANSAAKRAPRTALPTVEKARAAAATKSAPPSPLPAELQKTTTLADSQRRMRETKTMRPSSAGLSSHNSLPSPPVRTHARHRSMDIMSLLNSDEPASEKSYSPVNPPALPHMNAIEPARGYTGAAPESFLRGRPGPMGTSGGPSMNFSPLTSAGRAFGNAPLTPNSPNQLQKSAFDAFQRHPNNGVQGNFRGTGPASKTTRSRTKTADSDSAPAPKRRRVGLSAVDLLTPDSANAFENALDSGSELSEIAFDPEPSPTIRTRSRRAAAQVPTPLDTPVNRQLSNGFELSTSPTQIVFVDSRNIVPETHLEQQNINTINTQRDGNVKSKRNRADTQNDNLGSDGPELKVRSTRGFTINKPSAMATNNVDGTAMLKRGRASTKQNMSDKSQTDTPAKSRRGRATAKSADTESDIVSLTGEASSNAAEGPRVKRKYVRRKDGVSRSSVDIFAAPNVMQQSDGSWQVESPIPGVKPRNKPIPRESKRNADAMLSSPTVGGYQRTPSQNSIADEEYIEPSDHPETPEPSLARDSSFASPEVVKKVPAKRKASMKATANKARPTLYHENAQANKPEPSGEPPAWAQKRQQLCEALPYYRAYQSGAYSDHGLIRGFLIDKEVGERDKFTDEVVIARVGGGRTLDADSGKMMQTKDQSRSSFFCGFERAKLHKQPIVIIAGQGNRISPSKLPHYYNILDWFHVTDVWCELNNGVKTGYVRLEKINLWAKSWWAPKDSYFDPTRQVALIERAKPMKCGTCHQPSKGIYKQGWACLNTMCSAFFNFGYTIDDATLDYNDNFMLERTGYFGKPLAPIVPTLWDVAAQDRSGTHGYESGCAKGMVCPQCKGCTRRIHWHAWKCEHDGCDYTYEVPQETISVAQAMRQGFSESKEVCKEDLGILSSESTLGMYDVSEYKLPGENTEDGPVGFIRHFKSPGIVNSQPDGPNDLFKAMQERDFGLKRNPARQDGSVGEILTSHWAANWGAPYKYGVQQISKGFEEAPPVILKAVKRLTWAGNQAVAANLDPFQPFNELLSIGYMENTQIGFHDDGESTLGPTIATLSLGCQATMKFRPKAKSNIGPKSNNMKGGKPIVLTINLNHGDLVVMHGAGIQKLYEHSVTPHGKLRFALTCRYVKPELMPNDEERALAAIKGTLPPGHEQYDYDGDVNLSPADAVRSAEEVSASQLLVNDLRSTLVAGEFSRREIAELRRLIEREDRAITNPRHIIPDMSANNESPADQVVEIRNDDSDSIEVIEAASQVAPN